MRTVLLHNPSAGDEENPTAGQLMALIKEAGHKVTYQSTREKGWRKALKAKWDFVVVGGGDGTVSRVARRLINSRVPLAVLPLGTANNISRTLGISQMRETQLIRSWESARRITFDAGLALGPWGESHFIEGVGTGLLTHAIPRLDTSKTLRQLPEKDVQVAYAQQVFREHVLKSPARNIEATVDGKDISGRYVLFEVLKMQYVGPNLFLGPNLKPDDGEFEVICVSESHRRKLHSYIKHWQEGRPWPHELRALRGREVEIKWSGHKMHLDDRIWPEERKERVKSGAAIKLSVISRAVDYLIPESIHERQLQANQSTEKAKVRELR